MNYETLLEKARRDWRVLVNSTKIVQKEIYENNPKEYLGIVYPALKQNGSALVCVPEEIQKEHPELLLELIKERWNILQYVTPAVQEEIYKKYPQEYKEVLSKMIERNWTLLQYITPAVQNVYSDLLIEAVKRNESALHYINPDVQKANPDILMEAVKQTGFALAYINSDVQKANPEIVLLGLSSVGKSLKYISEEVQEEIYKKYPQEYRGILSKIIGNDWELLQYVPKNIQKEYPIVVFKAGKQDYRALDFVPDEIKEEIYIENPEKYIEMVKYIILRLPPAYQTLRYIPNKLEIDHPEIVLEAIKKGASMYFLDEVSKEIFKKNPDTFIDMLMIPVKRHDFMFEFILQELPSELHEEIYIKYPQKYVEIVNEILDKDIFRLKDVLEKFKMDNPKMIFEKIQKDGRGIIFFSKEAQWKLFTEDEDACVKSLIELMKQNGLWLKYINEEILQKYPEIILSATKSKMSAEILKSFDYFTHMDIIQKNIEIYKEIVMAAIKKNSYEFNYWSIGIQTWMYENESEWYLGIIKESLKKDKRVLNYIPGVVKDFILSEQAKEEENIQQNQEEKDTIIEYKGIRRILQKLSIQEKFKKLFSLRKENDGLKRIKEGIKGVFKR